jgi:predicted RNA-binding Zn-ribbon protein involved in translation (DUF1610 family)
MFHLWFCLWKVVVLGLLAVVIGATGLTPWSGPLIFSGACIAFSVVLTEKLLVLSLTFGWKWHCPLCGELASLVKARKMVRIFECPNCGLIEGEPFFDWRMKKVDNSVLD